MTADREPPLDALAEALRLLDVASTYGYAPEATVEAVLANIGDLDADQLRQLVAAMAVVTCDYARLETLAHRYQVKANFDLWLLYLRSRVAVAEQP